MIHISALHHLHPEPDTLVELLTTRLGFTALETDAPGHLLENGSVRLRLGRGESATPLRLEVVVRTLESAVESLLATGDWHLSTPPANTCETWCEQRLSNALGVELILLQHIDEDQRNLLMPLPTSLEWGDDAAECLQRLLRLVPLDFRDSARRRAVERAEYLAVSNGALSVSISQAVQGLVDVTPAFQHTLLAEQITLIGLEPAPYFAAREPC